MRISMEGRLAAMLFGICAGSATAGIWLMHMTGSPVMSIAGAIIVLALPVVIATRRFLKPLRQMLRALVGAVASYRDGDFSISLAVDRRDELGELALAHNALSATLRDQRHGLVQREMLLETVMEQSPVAIVLCDAGGRVVYSNKVAWRLINDGARLQGAALQEVLESCERSLRDAVESGTDCLFSVQASGEEEAYHIAQRTFLMQGQRHTLLLIRRMTRELSRQEVNVWKKLIRVLSHELNNSLAPISSLASSAAELARRGNTESVLGALGTISDRAAHLHQFIGGYATFARLPSPRIGLVRWNDVIAGLERQVAFVLVTPVPETGSFDRSQVEQVLINLLKNAHESGSPSGGVELAVSHTQHHQQIEVRDRGSGMSDPVLSQALLPFYSTKRSGTGLGLALSREIVEAHGGTIRLSNRPDGGLVVTVVLPRSPEALQ